MKSQHSVWIRSLVLTLVIAGIGMLTLGCNTLRGVGEDTESAGKGIQRSTR